MEAQKKITKAVKIMDNQELLGTLCVVIPNMFFDTPCLKLSLHKPYKGDTISCVIRITGDSDNNFFGYVGIGRARGYGYCKFSAAIHSALVDAGLDDVIEIPDCDSRGISAAIESIRCVVRQLYKLSDDDKIIIVDMTSI